jgi:PAS domain S-box-containing protein
MTLAPDAIAFVGQQASQALLAGLFAIAHYALFRQDRRQFLSLWAIGWCAVFVTRLLSATEAIDPGAPGVLSPIHPILAVLNDWSSFLALAALGTGSLAFTRGRPNSAPVLIGAAAVSVGLALATGLLGPEADPPWRYPVKTGLASLGCLAAGLLLWRGGAERQSARSVAVLVAGYSIPLAGYAAIAASGDGVLPGGTLQRFVAVGYLDTVLMASMALAMIVWLLNQEREAAGTLMQRERALRTEIEEREIRFRSVLQSLPDAIAVLDSEGRYVLDLRPERGFLGWSSQQWIGKPMLELVHPEDRERAGRALASLAAHPGTTETVELRVLNADDRWHTVECSGTSGVAVAALGGILVVARDITDRRALERRLARAERMETVGRLAGGVAHDFNNLLTVVRGNAAVLEDRLGRDSPEGVLAAEIDQAALRGVGLTRHLLAFARRQPVAPRVVDLSGLVSDLIPIVRRLVGESIDLTWRPAPYSCLVLADPHQLEQVVLNLCANAKDAMPNGGRVTLAVGREGVMVRLVVEDSGVGMSDAIRARAFEPFFTTKSPGTGAGLGLATSYGIVEEAGGSIAIESEPGQGTVVTLRLPAASEAEIRSPAASRAAPSPAPRGSGLVLVVEDEPTVRSMATRALRSGGFEVIEAGDGLEGANQLVADQRVVAVVTDVVMPGLSGDRMALQIWESRPKLPVVFTSGYAQEFLPGASRGQFRWSFLEKPYQPEELVQAVVALLAAVPSAGRYGGEPESR